MKKTSKTSHTWMLTNRLLNNEWVNNEIKKEIKKCLEINGNGHTTTQNLWNTVRAVLRGKFIAIQAYLKRMEKSQMNNLTLQKQQKKSPD